VTAIIINLWIDHLATVRLHLRERALLVDAHQPTVADNVSREDRRKSPLYAVVWHACSNFLDQAIVIREHLAGRLVAYDQKADLFVPRLRCLLWVKADMRTAKGQVRSTSKMDITKPVGPIIESE
jgi:hypothetical protein